ncbi:S-adenosyl-L-methionine-dependent methyltransferase [Calycina marina]|uniref:S-adenosyl-L-methionine-dependent methyltransferase n=1 Tax=Calycina marina TaxID=1763456 RepID=A0A9P7Z6V3_9HELO|nr:S-adenosyl-L-methionine-dependent methyltransferase [Calycina marina]
MSKEPKPVDWQAIGPSARMESTLNYADWKLTADTNDKNEPSRYKSTGHTISDAHSIEEGGRTYQAYKDGQKSSYYLPNDGAEQDRLDVQHKMFRVLLDGKLGLAPVPVDKPFHVLDIATGTGIWALDYAEENPLSRVTGTDLSLIQPKRTWVPNCEFIRDDAEDSWLFPQKFDYIHLRAIASCFSDTQAVMKQAFDHMNEGAYIELQDFVAVCIGDETMEGTGIHRWAQLLNTGFLAMGRDMLRATRYKAWLEEIGFTDVVELRESMPTNAWPRDRKYKEVGRWATLDCASGIPGLSTRALPAAGLTPEECLRVVQQALNDIHNRSIHAIIPIYIVYGRKPFAHESK